MVFIAQWDEFAVSSERMFVASPLTTRVVFRYRAKDGNFEIKVTDNQKCLKYKSNQKADIRKMEALNMRLMDLMTAPATPADGETEEK